MLINHAALCCAIANSIQTLPLSAGDFAVKCPLWPLILCLTSSTEYRNAYKVRSNKTSIKSSYTKRGGKGRNKNSEGEVVGRVLW